MILSLTLQMFILILILFLSLWWNELVWLGLVRNNILGFKISNAFVNDETSNYNLNDVTHLFIGITSNPDHFRQRQSLRQTWINLLPDTFRYSFFIGKESCRIHPLDRKSIYGCDSLDVVIPEGIKEDAVLAAYNLGSSCTIENDKNIGFSFHVNFPIVVSFLGVRKTILAYNESYTSRVSLIDLQTSTKLASVEFDHESPNADLSGKDYVYKALQYPVVLPKGFYGAVKVEVLNEVIQDLSDEISTEWSHRNIISVFNVLTRNVNQTYKNYCGMSTFSFSVKDITKMKNYLQEKQVRTHEWSLHVDDIESQLIREASLNNDLIFLDMVDVYRHLPEKVLKFFEWVYNSYNVQYVMKTDDDTFIDIPKVKLELDKGLDWGWWSCFRVGWPVQRYGKWRETAFPQEKYPPFPSGAGYVLSRDALTWLHNRRKCLSTKYQGEDVAVGIWLEGMNLSRHVGAECYWACDKQCLTHTCNAMDLSVSEVYKMWKQFHQCGSTICHCPR